MSFLAAVMVVDTTSSQVYWFGPLSVSALFGGSLPKRWGVFVAQNTTVALHATAGNHVVSITPVYATVV